MRFTRSTGAGSGGVSGNSSGAGGGTSQGYY